MNINKAEKVIINISLSKKEAKWLKEILQNFPYPEESKEDKVIRRTLWLELNNIEELWDVE